MDDYCDCGCHVNPRDYVPVCRIHGLPLIRAEHGNGLCPWQGRVITLRGTSSYGEEQVRERCHAWGPTSWAWAHRDKFDGRDLPPHNGFQPPDYDREGGPTWERQQHYCRRCRLSTLHLVGESRRVCFECGAALYMATPFYAEEVAP